MDLEHSLKSEKYTRKACDQCTSAKTRCDGAEPCQRCCKRNVTCNFSFRRRSGPKRKRGGEGEELLAASAPVKHPTNAAAAPAAAPAAAAAAAGIAGGTLHHVAAVGLPGVSSSLVVPLTNAAGPWSHGAYSSATAVAASFVTSTSGTSLLSSNSTLTSSSGGIFASEVPEAAFSLPPHSDATPAGRFGGIPPATIQTPWQLHLQQQQQRQQKQQQQQQQATPPLGSQLPFFGINISPFIGASAGFMPPVSLEFSPADFAMMSMAQLPQPMPAAWEPSSFEIAALRADPRYLVKYMELVNSFLPLVEVSKLGEALAATPLPPPPSPVLVGQDGAPVDAAAEAAAAAGEESNAHRAAIQAMLWAAVGLGALFSGDGKCAARQMRLSRAFLQRCFDSPEPELVAIFLLHVLYWFHKVDVKKVQRYMGYAQQAARDAGESNIHSDVIAVLRFMSAVMRVSVTTAVAYEACAPRPPEVLARIKGPKRFIAIVEDVFFNMFLAFPPQGGGCYVDNLLPARLTRALQEADSALEAMERPSVIAKTSIQGLHAYFQLAAGQTDLALRAAEGMARSVSQEPTCLRFPPCFVLSRGVGSLLRSCGSMPAALALETAMAPLYTQVVYANSVCSVGRELLRVFMSPPLLHTGKGMVDVTVSSSGDRDAVLGSLGNSLVSCGNGSNDGFSGGSRSCYGGNSSGRSGSGELFRSGCGSPNSGCDGGDSDAAKAAVASPARIKRDSLVLDLSSCSGGDLTSGGGGGGDDGIGDIDIDRDRLSPMSLNFLEGAIEAIRAPSCSSTYHTASACISPPTVQQPTLLSPTPSPSLEHGQEQALETGFSAIEPASDTSYNAAAEPTFTSALHLFSSSGGLVAAAPTPVLLAPPPSPPALPMPSDAPMVAPTAKRIFPAKQALLRLQQHTSAADHGDASSSVHRASPFLVSTGPASAISPRRSRMNANPSSCAAGSSEDGAAATAAGVSVAPLPMKLEEQQQQQPQEHEEVHAPLLGLRGAATNDSQQVDTQSAESGGNGKQLNRRISVSISSSTPGAAVASSRQVPRSPVTVAPATATLAPKAESSVPASPPEQPQQGPSKQLEWQKVLFQQQARQQSQLRSLQDQLQQQRRQQEAAMPMQLQRSLGTAPMARDGIGSLGVDGGRTESLEALPGRHQQSPGGTVLQQQEPPAPPRQQQRLQEHLQLLQQQLLQQQQRHKSLMATEVAAAQAASDGQQPHQPVGRVQAAAAHVAAAAQPQEWAGLSEQKAVERSLTASLLRKPTQQQQTHEQQYEQQLEEQHEQQLEQQEQQQWEQFSKPGHHFDEMRVLRQQVALSQQVLPPMMAAGGAGAVSEAPGARGSLIEMQDLQMLGL